MMAVPSERYYVLYTSSFRYEVAPNISHETIDKVRTLCGRKGGRCRDLRAR